MNLFLQISTRERLRVGETVSDNVTLSQGVCSCWVWFGIYTGIEGGYPFSASGARRMVIWSMSIKTTPTSGKGEGMIFNYARRRRYYVSTVNRAVRCLYNQIFTTGCIRSSHEIHVINQVYVFYYTVLYRLYLPRDPDRPIDPHPGTPPTA